MVHPASHKSRPKTTQTRWPRLLPLLLLSPLARRGQPDRMQHTFPPTTAAHKSKAGPSEPRYILVHDRFACRVIRSPPRQEKGKSPTSCVAFLEFGVISPSILLCPARDCLLDRWTEPCPLCSVLSHAGIAISSQDMDAEKNIFSAGQQLLGPGLQDRRA